MPLSPEHTQMLRAAAVAMMPEAVPVAAPTVPEQVELFEPPPFDFEAAYDELHRLDQRARLRKSAWEIAKSDASDAKKGYDSAIEDLHKKFAEIERARSEALKPRLMTEGGETVSEMETTIDERPEDEQPEEPPTDETPAE